MAVRVSGAKKKVEELLPPTVLGMVETASIAAGIKAADAIVKAAPVALLESRPLDPGKYINLVTGELASVEASIKAALAAINADDVLETFVLANLHALVVPALHGQEPAGPTGALGILETRTAAAVIEAVDAACKAASVSILKLRIGLHLGGKGYATLTGELPDIEAAVSAGALVAGESVVSAMVIPKPYPELFDHLAKRDDSSPSHR